MKKTIAVVGGGIVGTSLALRLAEKHGAIVTLFEKEAQLGRHQSGHNSGVVHAGIYYRSDSLKAQLVQEGRGLLRNFCERNEIPYIERGKIVVATSQEEIGRLDELEKRAIANKVPDITRISSHDIRRIEPHASGIEALYSPRTAVVDYPLVIRTAALALQEKGGRIMLEARVTNIKESLDKVIISLPHGKQEFDKAYVCAGIETDGLAPAEKGSPQRLVPFRGEYLELSKEASSLVRGLIYPVPDPKFPFLGVHFTRGHSGEVHIGPNATLALARNGYRNRDVNLGELFNYGLWPGTLRLVFSNPAATADQALSSLSRRYFVRSAQKLVPDIRQSDLAPKKWSGVRAQAVSRNGSLIDDFIFKTSERVTVVQNAPSPAATASFAIARYILEKIEL